MSNKNLDDGCPSTSTAIKKNAAKDKKRCSLRKGKLRKRHSTRTIKTGKPIIPPKPQLLSSGKPIVSAESQASHSKPGKPAIPPKPCLSKSKAARPIIAPKPRIAAWESGRPIIQLKRQVSSNAPEANIRPMPPVTQMCPIAVLTPMGFLIPRNFPSAVLMNQAVTFAEDEQIHPDDPVQVGSSGPVAQTHDFHKRTNDSNISDELQRQLTDLFTSMCQIQDSAEVADHIETEDFGFPSVFKHTKDSTVMQNSRLALALKNILLEVQVIQSEAPEMMEMLEKKNGEHKEDERGVRAISARFGTASKAGESNNLTVPSTDQNRQSLGNLMRVHPVLRQLRKLRRWRQQNRRKQRRKVEGNQAKSRERIGRTWGQAWQKKSSALANLSKRKPMMQWKQTQDRTAAKQLAAMLSIKRNQTKAMILCIDRSTI
ncbi:unnamed protein product [Cylicocyclus nassatus]|uniref:Uncharacterized protein n=1 Tax=Cylicocyclus nassatus TaxID=53992 RepID=A0AA36GR80_CYLNA|nr:unnamed protein product [Cylicocyclus nassatus]